jgi:hypothetical protein
VTVILARRPHEVTNTQKPGDMSLEEGISGSRTAIRVGVSRGIGMVDGRVRGE